MSDFIFVKVIEFCFLIDNVECVKIFLIVNELFNFFFVVIDKRLYLGLVLFFIDGYINKISEGF